MVASLNAEQQRRAEIAELRRELEVERQRHSVTRDQLSKCQAALALAEADLDDARGLLAVYRSRTPES